MILVTGGGGFIGKAIVTRLRERGEAVRSFSRGAYPELATLGCELHQGDLTDAAAVAKAVSGCSTVFHVAAKAGVWGARADYEATNVQGTQAVLEAARAAGVEKFVYTSSPSVAHGGGSLEGVDASHPYPHESEYLADYPRTKAIAERAVRAANAKGFATVALRPHLVWGPGDNHLLPRIVARAKAGRLRIVGDGLAKVDSTVIDNAAEAHLAAAAALRWDGPLGGNAYFVSNGEPLPVGELLNRIIEAMGAPRANKHIPFGVAYAVGAVSEVVYRGLGLRGEPLMTRFVASQLATAHWFDISACQRDFGWSPRVSIAQGLEALARAARG